MNNKRVHHQHRSLSVVVALSIAAGLTGCTITDTGSGEHSNKPVNRPNFVVIFVDDLGYGDLGSYGHPTIRTPNLDQLAHQSQKWTNFYAAAPVCTPSRAALLTGRLPVRSGMSSPTRRVLFPDSLGGIPQRELTIAELLKEKGYSSACIGKWHLGHLEPYLPTNNGFDYFYGTPYSNDEDEVRKLGKSDYLNPSLADYNLPLMENTTIIERPADQRALTQRYTQKAVDYIRANRDQPFFLYLAHNFPHIPLFASDDFIGKSPRGFYGDVVEELDYSVGEIVRALEENGIAKNTLLVFTSDNGPWAMMDQHAGSAGLLRGSKGQTFEGGMRVPAIFHWPGTIKPMVVTGMGSTMDLYVTLAALAGAELPSDRIVDGMDLKRTLIEGVPSPREVLYYYRGGKMFAIRKGPYKVHYLSQGPSRKDPLIKHSPPLMYNVEIDPSEKYDIAAEHPEVLKVIEELRKQHMHALVEPENQLEKFSDSARTIPKPY